MELNDWEVRLLEVIRKLRQYDKAEIKLEKGNIIITATRMDRTTFQI